MKYKINPRKLAKSPAGVLPFLFAEMEFDDQSQYFSILRPYMLPATEQERHQELIAAIKQKRQTMQCLAERRFDEAIDKIQRNLKNLIKSCSQHE